MDSEQQRNELKSKLAMCQSALEQIAGEINDNLGQLAATIKVRLHIIQLKPAENTHQNLEELKFMLSDLIKGLQNIAGDKVNSIILDLPKF